MEITKLACPGCGAVLREENGKARCAYCGGEIIIESKTVEKRSERVTDSTYNDGSSTMGEIAVSTQKTQNELKRLQASQELSALQMQLSNLRSEKRSLMLVKNKSKMHKNQIQQIEGEERTLSNRISTLESYLFTNSAVFNASTIPQTNNVKEHAPRSQAVALSLAFFLGFLGAHRFYTGHTKLGIIYLFTMGIFGFGWMYDIFTILINNYKDINGQKLIPMGAFGRKIALGLLIAALIQAVIIKINQNAPDWTVFLAIGLAAIIVNLKKVVAGMMLLIITLIVSIKKNI